MRLTKLVSLYIFTVLFTIERVEKKINVRIKKTELLKNAISKKKCENLFRTIF